MANKPSNVISIENQMFWKQFKNRLKRERSVIQLEADMWDNGTTRITGDDEVLRPTDAILFGETEAEVREWFAKVGFPMPQTWAEFRAGQWYISRLAECIDTVRIGYPHIPKDGFEFVEYRYNYIYEPFVLAIQDDWEGVAAWHKKHRTFAKIVREYDESKELPDPDSAKFSS
jgi:hypothetical protein